MKNGREGVSFSPILNSETGGALKRPWSAADVARLNVHKGPHGYLVFTAFLADQLE